MPRYHYQESCYIEVRYIMVALYYLGSYHLEKKKIDSPNKDFTALVR